MVLKVVGINFGLASLTVYVCFFLDFLAISETIVTTVTVSAQICIAPPTALDGSVSQIGLAEKDTAKMQYKMQYKIQSKCNSKININIRLRQLVRRKQVVDHNSIL